jgi:hypothetical protein
MNDQDKEFVEEVNTVAFEHINRVLKRVAKRKMSTAEFVGKAYAYMVAAEALGYPLRSMYRKSRRVGTDLREQSEQDEV